MKLHTPSLVIGGLAAGLLSLLVAAAAPAPTTSTTSAATLPTYSIVVGDNGLAIRSNVVNGESWVLMVDTWVKLEVRQD